MQAAVRYDPRPRGDRACHQCLCMLCCGLDYAGSASLLNTPDRRVLSSSVFVNELAGDGRFVRQQAEESLFLWEKKFSTSQMQTPSFTASYIHHLKTKKTD